MPVSESLYAALSRVVSPLLAPAGFGQWEAVSALLVGFVAKEAVISSWAQTYALAEPASSHDPGALGVQLYQTFEVASGGHTGAAVAGPSSVRQFGVSADPSNTKTGIFAGRPY